MIIYVSIWIIHGLVNQLLRFTPSCSAHVTGVCGSLRPLQPFDHLVVWEATGKAVAFLLSHETSRVEVVTKSRNKSCRSCVRSATCHATCHACGNVKCWHGTRCVQSGCLSLVDEGCWTDTRKEQ